MRLGHSIQYWKFTQYDLMIRNNLVLYFLLRNIIYKYFSQPKKTELLERRH